MMKNYLATFAVSLAAINVAAAQDADDDGGMSGKAALGYLATSGNTESRSVNAALNIVLARAIWTHEFDATAIASTSEEVTTAEAYTAGYEARRDFNERSYLFTALDWASDRFSSYDSRISGSIGYGRRLVDTERHMLNTEIGAGARRLELVDGTSEHDAILRTTLDYAWIVNENTRFDQDVTIESGSSNTSAVSVSELRARLFGDVSLVLSYRVKRNSDVLPGTEKTDRFSSIALEYAF
jgi:putative salt-induced outer membrane protein